MGQKHSRDDAAVSAPKRRAPEGADLTGMLPFEIWTAVFEYLKDSLDRDALSLTCRYMLCVRRSGVRLLVIDSARVRITSRRTTRCCATSCICARWSTRPRPTGRRCAPSGRSTGCAATRAIKFRICVYCCWRSSTYGAPASS